MSKEIDELLAVLDMPEDEQWSWITEGDKVIKFFPDDEIFIGDPQKYLADLAFRLRDEADCMSHWWDGVEAVYQKAQADFIEAHIRIAPEIAELNAALQWFTNHSQPIHWIVASLIAKELAKEK